MRASALHAQPCPCSLAIASPALLRAQFQQPTPEELKMTADPKAPGAAAVYLNIEEIANDPLHYQSFYARIKVLQEKGKELATVELPYLRGDTKITDIKARTIHSDGTVIPLVVKPEDCWSSRQHQGRRQLQVNRKVFTLPSVEVGSILEYRYQLQLRRKRVLFSHLGDSAALLRPQGPLFLHALQGIPARHARIITSMYLIDGHGRVLNNLIWWSKLPPGVTVKADAGGHYSVDVTDIPPSSGRRVDAAHPELLYQGEFYYKSATSASRLLDRRSQALVKGCGSLRRAFQTHQGSRCRSDCPRRQRPRQSKETLYSRAGPR